MSKIIKSRVRDEGISPRHEDCDPSEHDVSKVLATSAAASMPHGSMSRTRTARPSSGGGPRKFGVSAAHSEQKFSEAERKQFAPSHAERVASGVKRLAGQAAGKVKQVASEVGAGMRRPSMARSLECPHCGEGISKEYAVKSLLLIAKSEGYDLDDELSQFLTEGADEEPSADEAEKALAVKDNKVASHRGKKPGTFVDHPRGKGTGEKVQRNVKPGNRITEKSLRLPVIIGDAQLVTYSDGSDTAVAKSIEGGSLHTPVARNLRAEREVHTGELTEE